MHLYIDTLKRRLDTINRLRVDRALIAMNPSCQKIYHLLPAFLHYHHPSMPGYLNSKVPHGVCSFTANEIQKQHLAQFTADGEDPRQPSIKNELPIVGIYSMGSTSSIAQESTSDLDIWVCHQTTLNQEQRYLLQQKCRLLEQWAAEQGVEVSFFLVDENRFRHQVSGNLGNEDCGSTQHILLLDEFYRSAVRLAGKAILWNIVPVIEEKNYDNYVLSLYAQGVINANEWVDFGGLSALSAEEYFGASLWQLYKSIDSPYKAVLKTLLLEAYSWEYPNTQLLALESKQYLHDDLQRHRPILASSFDAYCMMLERVSRYLIQINDPIRLDLVRRCFYLKVCEKLADNEEGNQWRQQIIHQLVSQWGWSNEHLSILNNRANWKIKRVREAHNELLDAMMQSYHHLIHFARRNNLSMSASPQDIGVLTRKLYATFEVLPEKITLFNTQISSDLSEKNLTFIQVSSDRVNAPGWYLYDQAPLVETIISHRPLEYHRHLSKLVAWAYFNGLLTAQTHVHIRSLHLYNKAKLQKLMADVSQHFPLYLPAPSPQALCSPCEIRHLAIMVNLEQDPTETIDPQANNVDLRQRDVLSFGQQKQCLVGSIDLLYRNSWNEVRTLHFSGEQALLEALKNILGKMHQDAAPPKLVNVFCYSQQWRSAIRTGIQQLVEECIELRLSSRRQNLARFKAIRVAEQIWGVFFERLKVSVQKLENGIDFYRAISRNKLHGLAIKMASHQVHLPPVVDSFASEGVIQFFFEGSRNNNNKAGFNIYILDEKNQVEVYHHCQGNREDLVRDISHFYSSSYDRFVYGSSLVNFNLPLFYHIVQLNGRYQVVPFYRSTALPHVCINTACIEPPIRQPCRVH
ncbi:class I adenylate cyclase [Candidatus Regiella endosymbiont of Tuberolachnus salignus]|uniref:class I adenylate cyclase n=1 Tax=Candidatus Regiella endosymbiont of Tuberolachnus salignus TaxID=3077956 RepID=UPI0030CDAA2A